MSQSPALPIPRPGITDDPPYGTAKDFLAALDPTSDRWTTGRWIFRGQANADWTLKASGVRDPDAFDKCGVRLPKDHQPAWSWRRRQQDLLLIDFARRLDQAGITIPTMQPPVGRHGETKMTTSAAPDPRDWPAMALAQHHGLPTLLLDWTRRGRVAAYFAAAEVAGNECAAGFGTHLAVYALQADMIATSTVDLGPRPGDGAREISHLSEYQAPAGTNPNMRAQAGLFTLLDSPDDRSVEEHLRACEEKKQMPSPLRRLVLLHGEARQLLRLLASEGIDGASMFPGADGVVKAIRETALWNLPKTETVSVSGWTSHMQGEAEGSKS